MTYQEALDYLDSLNTFGINLGLERIQKLVESMGHPEKRYKTIHVTGTNGKGSVTAMLSTILMDAGYKTGMYISPHLIDYTERISVSGVQISQNDFAAAVAFTKRHVDKLTSEGLEHPTQFEVITAAALYYFAFVGVECAVIEVGLGGALDSTNVIIPEVSVITNVTLEHTDRCGNTVAEIAKVKAGIIKPQRPVVTAAKADALAVITAKAQDLHCPIYVLNQDFWADSKGFDKQQEHAVFKTGSEAFSVKINLRGTHQVDNAAVASMAAHCLNQRGFNITQNNIISGLSKVIWPARFEVVSKKPVIVIDGAHNPDGAKRLRENLDRYFPGKVVVFFFGMLKDKDISTVATNLVHDSDTVITVSPLSERAASPEEIAQTITWVHVEPYHDLLKGIERAYQLVQQADDRVLCITGSLYLVGLIRQMILEEDRQFGKLTI